VNEAHTLVLKEAADLHRFLQPIAKLCAVSETDHPYYRKSSYEFFSHLDKLIGMTLKYLEDLPQKPSKYPQIQRSVRQKLQVLRSSWGKLHRYIKPSLDADALHIPLSLLDAFQDLLQQVPRCGEFEFAVFQLTEVNYAMLTYEEVNRIANRIAGMVKGKEFPPALSLVGIPYSQSSGLFLNCLIPHEMAHFVYQERVGPEIKLKVDEILNVYHPAKTGTPEEKLELSQIRGLINTWVEEVFCDLFAISLIGPAFTFAFAEMTSAALIGEEGQRNATKAFDFSLSHPADVARFYLHKRHLKALGWWEPIERWKCSPVRLLRYCERVHKQTALSPEINQGTSVRLNLQCFWEACEWLLKFVKEEVPSPATEIKDFFDQYRVISNYLKRAIVPSTIVTDSGVVHPSPAVLINSGYRFVLEELHKLLRNIEKRSENSVADRSWYTERLELWVLKALEDWRLLNKSKEAK
jgi:hypothetical protein